MMEGPGEIIMILNETAKYLKIVPPWRDTFNKMPREGKIPAVKISNQWRFRKDEINKWRQEVRNKEIFANKGKFWYL